jgi:integrase/recombinase XerD
MQIKKATASIFLETRTPKKDKTYPVKVKITYDRKRQYYGIQKISLSQEEFNRIYSPKPKPKEKELRELFEEAVKFAEKIIDEMPIFTFELFERKFFASPEKEDKNNVYFAYDKYIRELEDNDQLGTAETYILSKKSIMEFSGRKMMLFVEITSEFLSKYEKWQEERNKSTNTISIYLRCLRKLFNSAIADNVIDQKFYPFGRNKFIIPASTNIKRALSLKDIEKIFNYKASDGSNEEFARDLWVFSYLCNGMNVADICNLKYKNIQGDKILYIRKKTAKTKKHDNRPIVVMITEDIERIIKKWGNLNKGPETYLFSILEPNLSAVKVLAKTKQITKTINKYIKRIAKSVGIEDNITTYWARHSFAMTLRNAGASNEFIGDSFGHGDIRTTENYLNSFVDEKKREFAAKLTEFNSKIKTE